MAERSDSELAMFNPTRITPKPDKWTAEPSTWRDYNFNSEAEFKRWCAIRRARFEAAFAPRGPSMRAHMGGGG